MSGGVTANYGLSKPNFNVRPWDGLVNNNWDLIDTILYTIAQVPNIAGIWKNSTMYPANVNVLDPQTLVFYTSLLANTSAATGTFAADRLANPNNWGLTQPQQGAVRYDQGQALTAAQGLQALQNILAFNSLLRFDGAQTLSTAQIAQATANIGAYNSLLRFDAAQTLTYNQALQVLNTLGIDGTEITIASAATTDVGNVTTQNVVITGTTTITSFGTRPNKYKLLRFAGALTLTNSTALQLPSSTNITTQPGDTAITTSDASGNWYVRAYQRADGSTLLLYAVPATPSSAVTLAASDFDKACNVTGVTTISVGNVASGFRTGPIKNANAATGIVTLAIPTGATLDGVANGSLLLFPAQKARIIQTGPTSYISEWLDRLPLISQQKVPFGSPVALVDMPLPDGWTAFDLIGNEVTVSTSALFGFRLSNTDASGLKSGASDYSYAYMYSGGASGTGSSSLGGITVSSISASAQAGTNTLEAIITPGSSIASTPRATIASRAFIYTSGNVFSIESIGTACIALSSRATLMRILAGTSGVTFSGTFTLRGRA